MSDKITADTEVSGTELAAVLGLSKRRIEQLVQDGTIETVSKGRMKLGDAVQAYIRSVTKPIDEDDIKTEKARRKSEAVLKSSRAAIAKYQVQELQGKMHRAEDVAAMTEELVYTVRGALNALPGRLAVDVAAAGSAAEASNIIRGEVHKIMLELSAFRYDPAKYEARVRERMSLSERDTDDDE